MVLSLTQHWSDFLQESAFPWGAPHLKRTLKFGEDSEETLNVDERVGKWNL